MATTGAAKTTNKVSLFKWHFSSSLREFGGLGFCWTTGEQEEDKVWISEMLPPLFLGRLWSAAQQEEEKENEWEWTIELPSSLGKCFIGFGSLWCQLSPWGREGQGVSMCIERRNTGSPHICYSHVCNLLLTVSSAPRSAGCFLGGVPGAKAWVHRGRSDRTFYLLIFPLNLAWLYLALGWAS